MTPSSYSIAILRFSKPDKFLTRESHDDIVGTTSSQAFVRNDVAGAFPSSFSTSSLNTFFGSFPSVHSIDVANADSFLLLLYIGRLGAFHTHNS